MFWDLIGPRRKCKNRAAHALPAHASTRGLLTLCAHHHLHCAFSTGAGATPLPHPPLPSSLPQRTRAPTARRHTRNTPTPPRPRRDGDVRRPPKMKTYSVGDRVNCVPSSGEGKPRVAEVLEVRDGKGANGRGGPEYYVHYVECECLAGGGGRLRARCSLGVLTPHPHPRSQQAAGRVGHCRLHQGGGGGGGRRRREKGGGRGEAESGGG